MRALAWTVWDARRRPADLFAVLAAALYVAMVTRVLLGTGTSYESDLVPLPLVLGALLFLSRVPLSQAQSMALGGAAIAGAAVFSVLRLPANEQLALAAPAVVLAVLFATRRPALALGVVLICTGAFGSLDVLANVPAAKLADLLLVGLWGAAAWTWLLSPRREVPVRPALFGLGAYLVISVLEILVAASTTAAVQSFRGQNWYLAVVLLAAYAPWSEATRTRMLRAIAVVGLLIGGYATLRWAIGPAAAERTLAEQNPNNLLDGDLRPIGSFSTAKELAAWTAIVAPFLIGITLTERGRWRLVALVGAGLCLIGMLAADVRAGVAAATVGTAVVVILYQAAQAFRGRRGTAALLTIIAAGATAVGAFTLTLADKTDTKDRYTNILHPERDESYQARLVKWRTAINDIEDQPLGHGLGTSGRTQKRFATTTNIGSIDVDNSYLKVAFEQGFVIMIVLAGSLLLIGATLAKGAIVDLDPARAGPALAACGALASMLVLFWVGTYIEGLPALAGWLLVGLGLGQLTSARA